MFYVDDLSNESTDATGLRGRFRNRDGPKAYEGMTDKSFT